jgi:hypothetical protein
MPPNSRLNIGSKIAAFCRAAKNFVAKAAA